MTQRILDLLKEPQIHHSIFLIRWWIYHWERIHQNHL